MKLKDARTTNNMTQKQLADKVGVSEIAVCLWENGNSYPHAKNRAKVENLLGKIDWQPTSYRNELSTREQEEVDIVTNIVGKFVGRETMVEMFKNMSNTNIRKFLAALKADNFVVNNEQPEPLLSKAEMERFK